MDTAMVAGSVLALTIAFAVFVVRVAMAMDVAGRFRRWMAAGKRMDWTPPSEPPRD